MKVETEIKLRLRGGLTKIRESLRELGFRITTHRSLESNILFDNAKRSLRKHGKLIRVPVPPLTQERRQDMVKHLHKVLEEHRTAVRNIRRDGNDAIKKALKDKKITEDEEKRSLDEIQKLTDGEIKKMEEMSKAKEKEVLELK